MSTARELVGMFPSRISCKKKHLLCSERLLLQEVVLALLTHLYRGLFQHQLQAGLNFSDDTLSTN